MISDAEIEHRLHERLRRPASPSTVPGSLPVLCFGDLLMAKVATISLNPSRREYLDPRGEELDGPDRRFETLASLRAVDRSTLTAQQCNRAISTMRGYFDPGRPVYSWFAPLTRVLEGLGSRYVAREAVHLDLVQEATVLAWSEMTAQRPEEARSLLNCDVPFLRWQLETFPVRVLVCNGRSVLDQMLHLTQARTVAQEKLVRLTWTIAVGGCGGREVAVVGWNIPLARPTGLTAPGQVELGAQFRARLVDLGIELS